MRKPLPIVCAPGMRDRGFGYCERGGPSPVAASWGQRRPAFWYGIDHQRLVRDGANLNALLQEPAEEEPPERRLPPVEAEREFVEVGLKVVSLHRTLVRAQQPSLGEAGDPMHAWQEHMRRPARTGHVDRAVDVVGPNRQRVRLGCGSFSSDRFFLILHTVRRFSRIAGARMSLGYALGAGIGPGDGDRFSGQAVSGGRCWRLDICRMLRYRGLGQLAPEAHAWQYRWCRFVAGNSVTPN